jgi:hypothetical protein
MEGIAVIDGQREREGDCEGRKWSMIVDSKKRKAMRWCDDR